MSFQFENDFVNRKEEEVVVRQIPCALGDKCAHATVDECDQYRQTLLQEEHRKNCSDGENCEHFHPVKGIPTSARWRGEQPADFLKRTRGIQ